MRPVVLDASAVLAFLYGEPGGDAVAELLLEERSDVRLCSVNLCEVATVLAADGVSRHEIRENLKMFERLSTDFTSEMALRASEIARVTRTAGLSLGDRACLALAEEVGGVAWTTDRAWKRIKISVAIKLIRHE